MKVNSWLSRLVAALMAFGIAYAGVGCLAVGFHMEFRSGEWASVVWLLVAAAAACVFCFECKGGWWMLAVLTVVVGLFWWDDSRLSELEAFLVEITSRYNAAYGWKIIQWSSRDYSRITRHINMATGLQILGVLEVLMVSWVLCRKKPTAVAVAVAAIPLGACCIVTDTVPSEFYLWLLLGLMVLLMMTQGARRRSTTDGLRLTAMLMVPVMLASMALFWIAPKDSYEAQTNAIQQTVLKWLQELPFVDWDDQQGNVLGSYEGQVMDLANVGPKVQTQYAVMDVRAENSRELYLRGQSFDRYDGTSWSVSEAGTGADPGWKTGSMEELGTLTIVTRYRQKVIYVPYGYSNVLQLKGGSVDNSEEAVEFVYSDVTVHSVDDYDARLEQILLQCLQLPEDTRSAAEQILGVLPKGLSNRQIAQFLGNYVRNSAEYSLKTEKMPEDAGDFAIWFLTQSDTGYCVHYATAATVLLRAAGVPARYVTGYSQKVGGEAGAVTTITSDRAHAWVEYWDEESGWTVLDPTPPSWRSETVSTEPSGTESTETSGTESAPSETEETTQPSETEQTKFPGESSDPQETTGSTTQSGQTEATQSQSEGPGVPGNGGGAGGQVDLGWLWSILKVLAAILVAAGVVLGQYGLRVGLRRRKMGRGDCNRRALYRWRYARKVAKRMKLQLPNRLTKLAEKAAFSQHTLTEPEVAEFDAWLAQARDARRARPWFARIALKLIWAME